MGRLDFGRHASIWIGAVLVGLAAVLYASLVNVAQETFFRWFGAHSILTSAAAPFAFLIATWIVRHFAPHAKGSGIPQVLEAVEAGRRPGEEHLAWASPLVSLKTAVFKVLSSAVGILGGASIGREGPTVQIAASVFAWVGRRTRRFVPHVELPSYLMAGAAAGVAAAFNTPLAGITFAIEEVADGVIGPFRQPMILAVIISGITAQALIGNYLYFGRPAVSSPDLHVAYQAIIIGLAGGLGGGVFSRLLAFPKVVRLPTHWAIRAFVCGAICALIAYLSDGATAGSGYEATQRALNSSSVEDASVLAPVWKMTTTVLSYLAGMAGGIFSPSLSIGAGIGISIAKLLHFVNFRTCALMGMVAFFSGVVQAPLSSVVIVMEMTDRHSLILPFLVAAVIGQAVGRLLMPV
ncbi:MAG: chloride channel protein, partial [Bacteriovoracia bacterium]